MDQATVYSDDPAAQARAWQDAGCRWLHVVDLNGAFAGQPVNARRGRGDPGGGDDAGAARRRHPRHGRRSRPGSRPACARVILGSAAVKRPGAGAPRPAAPSPAGSRSASTRARGWSPPRAGPRPPRSAHSTSRGAARMRGGGDHLHRHRARRDAERRSTSRQTAALGGGARHAGDRQRRRRRPR